MWPFKRREPPKPQFEIGAKVWWQIISSGRAWAAIVIDVLPDRRYVVEIEALPGELPQFTEEDRLSPRSASPQPEKPA